MNNGVAFQFELYSVLCSRYQTTVCLNSGKYMFGQHVDYLPK